MNGYERKTNKASGGRKPPVAHGAPCATGGLRPPLAWRTSGRMAVMDAKLIGIVERVTFHNPENGFAVLRVQATGRRGLVTVVGNVASIVAGEQIEAVGSWVQDREHGQQFKATELKTTPPHSLAG